MIHDPRMHGPHKDDKTDSNPVAACVLVLAALILGGSAALTLGWGVQSLWLILLGS